MWLAIIAIVSSIFNTSWLLIVKSIVVRSVYVEGAQGFAAEGFVAEEIDLNGAATFGLVDAAVGLPVGAASTNGPLLGVVASAAATEVYSVGVSSAGASTQASALISSGGTQINRTGPEEFAQT